MPYNLEILLDEKSFEQLNSSERQFVLNQISKEEYMAQYVILQDAKTIFAAESIQLKPRLATQANLLTALQQKKKSPKIFAIFQHKTPTWVTVAACIAIVFLLKNGPFQSAETKQPLFVSNQVDTVYIEKFIPIETTATIDSIITPAIKTEKSIQKTAPKTKIRPKLDPSNITYYSDAMMNAEMKNYTSMINMASQPRGVSLANDSISQQINRTIF